jgi:hypothetical protein
LGVAADETGLLLVVVGVVGHFECCEGVSGVSGASVSFLDTSS